MKPLFVKFKPDNCTRQTRTPWAGKYLAASVKHDLGLQLPSHAGEFWEFSTSPELPSQCMLPYQGTFLETIRRDVPFWLSEAHRRIWADNSPLLVKYIDAEHDLSLQVHPPIQAVNLPGGHCGKWESWIILKHCRGAGIYLGLENDISSDAFEQAIRNGGDLKPFLHFVPVKCGEIYTIPPCTIHALGAGVCVIEPQIIHPGHKAVSLRLHDWNRCYDADGNISASGKPRELHIETALGYIDFDSPRGAELEHLTRLIPRPVVEKDNFKVIFMEQAPCLHALSLHGSGCYETPFAGELTSVMVYSGRLEMTIDAQHYTLKSGESGAIAASARSVRFDCSGADVYAAHCLPDKYGAACGHGL